MKIPKITEIFITDSEHPLFVPKSRENSKEFASSVMACTTAFGTPPYVGAWLRYQKTLGVDLVYINAAESFLYGDSLDDTFLQESLENGFVQLKERVSQAWSLMVLLSVSLLSRLRLQISRRLQLCYHE